MRGSVIKKGARWFVKIELDSDPVTGRRRQKWHSGYATKREAERARVDLLSKFDRGEYVEASRQSVSDYLNDWLKAIEHTVKPSTFDSYERNVRNHVIAHIGQLRLTKVDAGVLNGLYAQLLASGRRTPSRTGTGYSVQVINRALDLRAAGVTLVATTERLRAEFAEAEHLTKNTVNSFLRRNGTGAKRVVSPGLDRRTVNYVHAIMHRAFKDAVRWGRLARNPADVADPPRGAAKADGIQAWDAATLRAFLEASARTGDRLHALWVLLATTGMRRGEALGLRWSDLNLDTGRLRVVQTIIQTRSKVTIGEPKTASGRRPIAIDQGTVIVLRDHRRRMLEERLLTGRGSDEGDLVFHRPDGSWLHPDAVSDMFLRRVKRCELERLTLHGLRHTWATLALERGIHPRVVQERLGHSTISITLGMYSHVGQTLHDEAAETVAQLFL